MTLACRAVLAISWLAFLLFASASFGQCALPSTPAQGVPDSSFDALVTQNGPGWTSGDGTYSTALPDGTFLWGWSDSFIGTVDPNTRLRQSYFPTAHNSLTIQHPDNSITTVGYPPNTSSYFVPTNSAFEYWMGDAVVYQPSSGMFKVKIMLSEFYLSGTIIRFEGNAVAQLSWPSLSIDSVTPVPLPDFSIQWARKSCMTAPTTTFMVFGIPGRRTSFPIWRE